MALWSIKKMEVGPVSSFISEANVTVTLIDKDTGTLTTDTFLLPFTDGKLDVPGALAVLEGEGFDPNDFGI